MAIQLPETGYLRLSQIIGRSAVSDEQAAENRRKGNGPKRPRPAIPPLIPIGKSSFWAGVASGRYPQPVRTLSARVTAWRVQDIRALIDQAAKQDGGA